MYSSAYLPKNTQSLKTKQNKTETRKIISLHGAWKIRDRHCFSRSRDMSRWRCLSSHWTNFTMDSPTGSGTGAGVCIVTTNLSHNQDGRYVILLSEVLWVGPYEQNVVSAEWAPASVSDNWGCPMAEGRSIEISHQHWTFQDPVLSFSAKAFLITLSQRRIRRCFIFGPGRASKLSARVLLCAFIPVVVSLSDDEFSKGPEPKAVM